MRIERDKYLKYFTENDFPQLLCPCCRQGVLNTEKDTFKSVTTQSSHDAYDEVGEISMLELKFVTFLRCNNKKCKEIACAAGTGSVEEEYRSEEPWEGRDYPEIEYVHYYTISYLDPPTDIFNISDFVPQAVKDRIKNSFSLFWGHSSSSGNQLRQALELVMDEQKVNKTKKTKKGIEIRLNLHERLEEFGKIKNGKYKELADALTSLKLIGNFGSHYNALSREDLLDAYEIFDYVLDQLYVADERKNKVKVLTTQIKNKYGKI